MTEKLEKKQRFWFNYSTKDNKLWSWLGYSKDKDSSEEKEEPSQEEVLVQEDPVHDTEEHTQREPVQEDAESSRKKSTSWMSLFSNTTTTELDNTTESASVIKRPNQRNAVLPTFESQFAAKDDNLLIKAFNIIKSTLFTAPLDLMKQNIQAKKIVIVGVHGWFPMKLVRSMVGEPTGTSHKFCEQMKNATKNYFLNQHQLEIPDGSIITIPLFWEGKIQERVDKFEQQIKDEWAECLKTADIILWATHSQGTPVSVILMHRLIKSGLIRPHQQLICMLAMAGISHGPFPTIKGNLLVKYFEADAARELFEFMDSESDISCVYRDSLAFVLDHPIKVVLVGSMQDQVVPLYSAIMSGLTHPNLLRAIYIDGHIYSPDDFLIRLIAFALQLLNLGLSDHGFLIHISDVLAGNLYSFEGGGHSTLYEELDVFTLPLKYLFETHPLGLFQRTLIDPQAMVQKARLDRFQAKLKLNPFHLPWAMRGIWDDPKIMKNQQLREELEQLQTLFDDWNPASARLKEIKFRLEPLKARL